jgi:hypothetical protein
MQNLFIFCLYFLKENVRATWRLTGALCWSWSRVLAVSMGNVITSAVMAATPLNHKTIHDFSFSWY